MQKGVWNELHYQTSLHIIRAAAKGNTSCTTTQCSLVTLATTSDLIYSKGNLLVDDHIHEQISVGYLTGKPSLSHKKLMRDRRAPFHVCYGSEQ
jgi:hypothetical protein